MTADTKFISFIYGHAFMEVSVEWWSNVLRKSYQKQIFRRHGFVGFFKTPSSVFWSIIHIFSQIFCYNLYLFLQDNHFNISFRAKSVETARASWNNSSQEDILRMSMVTCRKINKPVNTPVKVICFTEVRNWGTYIENPRL